MNDYFETRERLRALYHPKRIDAKVETLGDGGFIAEVAGRVIVTAPASTFNEAGALPAELQERWEKASSGNPYMMWLQGRFVEAEKANRNGAFWSTADLQYGEMSVRNGPLNWLHDEKLVIGTIADNALVMPSENAAEGGHPRPYMAAVSSVWKWVHPDKVNEIQRANDMGRLYYSMECVGREISCVSDETHVGGCGKSFDYITAMTSPQATCEHMQSRTAARRIVDPAFLGGAVIVPPTQPGWAMANVEIMRQSAAMAEATAESAGENTASEWELLMAQVLRYATR